MKEKASEVVDSFTTTITKGITGLTDFIGKSWDGLKEGISNGISSVITNLGNLGSSILDSIKNSAVAKSAGKAWNAAKSTYSTAKNWAKDKIDGAKDLWNKAKVNNGKYSNYTIDKTCTFDYSVRVVSIEEDATYGYKAVVQVTKR